uniref:Uncharacterized protein n=1 Tax=Tanacetum cinerariifolium TaxID=118510 RepID=A0A699V908_TANCI|nr:hypothetical protein [Tanacetum cinerariifolium]
MCGGNCKKQGPRRSSSSKMARVKVRVSESVLFLGAQWEVRAQPFLIGPDGAAHVQTGAGWGRGLGARQHMGRLGVVGRQPKINVAQLG